MSFKRTQVCKAALAVMGSAVGLTSLPAMAQQDAQRVEITGSRILSIGATSPAPIQVITSEDIAKSGVTNIQDLLLKNPTIGTPGISRTNSNFATASAGVSTVDLRDLGSDRTLVLVNGRRYVAGVPGSAAVDLNTIPVDFIERVEILTGGASATYGSDAVAGVVNIILKRDFEGVALNAQLGRSGEGDDDKKLFTLTGGVSSADGKSNIMAHFSYSEQGEVYGKDRSGNEVDNLPTAYLTGDPADLRSFTSPFLSSFAPQGRIFYRTANPAFDPSLPVSSTNQPTLAANRTFDKDGNIIPVNTNGSGGATPTGFNRQDFRLMAVPTERYQFATKGELAIHQDHNVFFEGNYTSTQVRSNLEPFPLDSADGTGGLYPASGVGPAEFRVGNQILKNPMVPQALFDQMVDTDGDGLRDYSFSRRLSEVGNRGSTADRDTFRIITGAKGIVAKNWDYDTYIGYGATKESQVSGGQVNVLNFRNAMEAVPDVNDLDGDGDTAEAICLDANARSQGCVPANIFGFNALSPAAVNYITAPGMLSTYTSQKLAGGVVRGEPMMLPAGPLALAAGFEWREEYSRSEFDPLQQAGLNAGNAIPRTEGSFKVTELYAEVLVPVLKDENWAKSLSISGALRGADYSTVGTVPSWSLGADWAPNSQFRVRATTSLSTRAPNISELYSPPSQNFPSVNDPCAGVSVGDTGTLADRCRAAPGVLANMNANGGVFTLNQADIQGVSGFDRGNPNAQEETGESWTLGLVYTPAQVRNLSFEVDYYNIEIEDALVPTPRQFALDQCYNGGDVSFCDFITRRTAGQGTNSPGSLSFVDTAVSNSGGLASEGVDLIVNWADVVGPGRFNTRFAYTYLIDGYTIPLPGAAKDPYDGEVGAAKNKFNWLLGYNWNGWSATGVVTYIGSSALDDQFLAGFDAPPRSVKIPSKTYLDLQFGYQYRKANFYVGIDNVFDTAAPRADTNGLLGGIPAAGSQASTGAGTWADVYDAIGRRFYVGVRMAL